MYICSATTFKTESAFRVLKECILSMPQKKKIVFLMKYILQSYKAKNRDAMLDGLESLCSLSPETAKLWAISKNTFNEAEGARIDLLYKLAIR